jgi:hypothetical protein
MPECLMLSFADRMDAIIAARLLDAAQAAAYPHIGDKAQGWYRDQVKRLAPLTAPRRADGSTIPRHRSAVFFWNGTPIASDSLKRELAGALGRGFGHD